MKKILFLLAMLSCFWCQAQRDYYQDDVVKIIKNWFQNEAPHHYPQGKSMGVRDLAQLKKIEPATADSIIFLVLRLGKKAPDSIRHDTVSLAKFKNLEYLAILDSPYAPFDFKGLPHLKTLFFDYVYNLEAIPETIGELTGLEALLITGANRITSLPEGIYNLSNLKTLKLTGLRDTIGTISDKIRNLKQLEFLEINGTVDVPETIGELHNLKELRMDTKFGTNRPAQAIFNLPKLEILGYYAFEEAHLVGIEQLQSLRILNLYTYFLSPEIGKLKNLEGLKISGFKNGTYPDELANLKQLQALQISGNDSAIEAPKFIQQLSSLRYLQIYHFSKMATFGPNFIQLKKLEEVDLQYGNFLLKEIPESLSHLGEKVKFRKRR